MGDRSGGAGFATPDPIVGLAKPGQPDPAGLLKHPRPLLTRKDALKPKKTEDVDT